MFIVNALLFVALTLIGALMASAGTEGLRGRPRIQPLSLLILLMNRYAPQRQFQVEPAILKLESLGWLMFGLLLTGLGLYGLRLILIP
jgi:hypothetical protein